MEKQYRCESCNEIKPRFKLTYCQDCTNAWLRKKYQENKEKICAKQREKVICDCGSVVSNRGIYTHFKSKKHSKLMEQQNNDNPLDV